jgi:hypothetical protein
MAGAKGKLYEDALKLSVNKNLADIKTLLGWAENANTIEDKLRHIHQAVTLLTEIETNLADLRK